MGGALSVSVARNEELLQLIRSLDRPEDALLDDEALRLVECSFSGLRLQPTGAQVSAGSLPAALGAATAVLDPGTTKDADEDDEEDEAGSAADDVGKPSLGIREDGECPAQRALARLSGRHQNVVPVLYGSMLLARRLVVLEHIRVVLLERKAWPGHDPFFASFGPAQPSAVVASPPADGQLSPETASRGVAKHPRDLSLVILSNLCTSALEALQSLGAEVTQPVVSGLRTMMQENFAELGINSLGTASLDDTMDFLLTSFDEHGNSQALETLCILATGRGSVHYLLQLALRLYNDERLVGELKQTLHTFLEKCALEAAKAELASSGPTYDSQRKAVFIRRSSSPRPLSGGWPMPALDAADQSEVADQSEGAEIAAAAAAAQNESNLQDRPSGSSQTEADVAKVEGGQAGDGADEEEEDADEEERELPGHIVGMARANVLLEDVPSEHGVIFVDDSTWQQSRILRGIATTRSVATVATSEGHLVAICTDGKAFAMGDNGFGQCGFSATNTVSELAEMALPVPVIAGAVGTFHTILLAQKGTRVLACGRNHFGQLGSGTVEATSTPTTISFSFTKSVKKIAAGGDHSAFLFGDSEVYGFGRIKDKACTHPVLLFCCESTSKVVDLASGRNFCVALEESATLSSSASSSSILTSLRKRRKRRRRKKQFRVITCLEESLPENGQASPEPSIFHAHQFWAIAATDTHIVALVDECTEEQRHSSDALVSPKASEAEELARFSTSHAGAAAILWGLEQFPVAGASVKFEISRILLVLLQKFHSTPGLMTPALRVLQRHCFVPSAVKDDDHVVMHDLKSVLFTLAKSPLADIKEEAIRAIGNGFAFLSPTAAELATFMSTITNMTYLSRFATLKFWSELFAQDQQDTARILIERLVDLAVEDGTAPEILDLLCAMQRTLLLSTYVEGRVINWYARSLAQASVTTIENARATTHDYDACLEALSESIVKRLAWPCMVMLHHHRVDTSDSSASLMGLLAAVDQVTRGSSTPMRSWLDDLEWTLTLLLIGKSCDGVLPGVVAHTFADHIVGTTSPPSLRIPDSAAAIGQGAPLSSSGSASTTTLAGGTTLPQMTRTSTSLDLMSLVPEAGGPINTSIFNSGFCPAEDLERRMSRFEKVVADEDHEVMGKVSKMNKVKFRNKKGAEHVWEALRAVYAAIKIFDTDDIKDEAHTSAMKILRWANQTKQALEDVDYEQIGRHIVARTAFLLQINAISEHSLFNFVQQYDHVQLQAYEEELLRQKEVMQRHIRGFHLFAEMIRFVKAPDVRRHVIFSFTDFASSTKATPVTRKLVLETVKSLLHSSINDPDLAGNGPLRVAVLDACVATNSWSDASLVPWVLRNLDFRESEEALAEALQALVVDRGASPTTPRPKSAAVNQTADQLLAISRDPQSLALAPRPEGLPSTLGIQFSRQHKHPLLRLSSNGLCFHYPRELPAGACHTAATIRLSHALYSGRCYLQLICTPATLSDTSTLLFALGLVPQDYNEWDGYIGLAACSLSAEQKVGVFIDMDAGHCLLFRHSDTFYTTKTVCYLEADNLLAIHKVRTKHRPLYPAVSLLSPGTTVLLRQVLIENDTVKIYLDENIDLKSGTFAGGVHVAGGAAVLAHQPGHATGDSQGAQQQGQQQLLQQGQQQQQLQQSQQQSQQQGDELQGSEAAQESRSGPSARNDVSMQNPEQDEEDEDKDKVSISVSGPLNLGLVEETELFVCGQNTYGELGLADVKPRKDIAVATTVKGLFPVQVVAGNEITGVLTSQGEVYVWGYNKNGACGKPVAADSLEEARILLPYRINLPVFITKLCCSNGSEHVLAVASTGQLYGWGFNEYGQLGLGHKISKVLQPTKIDGALRDKQVTLAAVSYSHSLALTSDGSLFGFGLNSRGQLGIGSTADLWTLPQRLAHLADIGKVVNMACGVEHSAAVMENGELYTFGRNDWGQLGIDDPSRQLSALPIRVANGLSQLQNLRCEAVACGYYYTVVIADGTLHAFGMNEFGQLGVGHNHEVFAPVPVLWNGEDDRFIAVACGTGHSVAATSAGRIIAWGRNKDGGLGNGTTVDHPFPVEICCKGEMSLSLRDQRPLHLAAGFHHTCVLVGARSKKEVLSSPVPNMDRVAWPLRAIKSSALALNYYLQGDEVSTNGVLFAGDYLLQRVREHFYAHSRAALTGTGKSSQLCPRHSAAPISLCCLAERREDALVGWITGMSRAGVCSPGLYLNHLLQLLLDLTLRWHHLREHIQTRRVWALELLFEIGTMQGSPVRTAIAFDLISKLLPGMPTAQMPESFAIRKLLVRVGRGSDLATAAQIVALLRTLLSTDAHGWSMCVNRALLSSLASQVPKLPDDVEDLSVFNEHKGRFQAMIGALQVLGASDEVLYNGASVSVVSGDVDVQDGTLDWFRPTGCFQEVGRVTFSSSSMIAVLKKSQLIPRARVPVPVLSIRRVDKVLNLLVMLVQQSVELHPSAAGLEHARSACLHEIAKARASRVIATLLHNQPSIVQSFVSSGHLQAVTSLLAAPRGRLDGVPIRVLQERYLSLEDLRRALEVADSDLLASDSDSDMPTGGPEAKQRPRRRGRRTSLGGAGWVCSTCGYKNAVHETDCQMCLAKDAVVAAGSRSTEAESASDIGEASPATSPARGDPADGGLKAALSKALSTSSIHGVNVSSPQFDELACNWSFDGGALPDNKKATVALFSTVDKEPEGAESKEIRPRQSKHGWIAVETEQYLRIEHCCSGNGSRGSVYLNQYSLVLDVRIPKASMEQDYIALLQTNVHNDSLADWYVRGNGSIGCIEYSEPNTVQPNKWHRLGMTVDLTNGEIAFYVDGAHVVSLVRQGATRQNLILEDDRWALDSSFFLFRDVDQAKDAPAVEVARVQLRSYVMSPSEMETLGSFTRDDPIPLPSVPELADRLSQDLKLPKAWCVRALQATQLRLPRARSWLRTNEQALIARTVAEAKMLTALGYSRKLCAHAICITSSLSDAIRWLLDNSDFPESQMQVSRVLQECVKGDDDSMLSSDMLALNLAEDDQDAHNKTYEMYDSTSGEGDHVALSDESPSSNNNSSTAGLGAAQPGGSGTLASGSGGPSQRSAPVNLPPLGCGLRQINAELWETARQQFISHARQATVSILESSLVVRSRSSLTTPRSTRTPKSARTPRSRASPTAGAGAVPDWGIVEDMQQKLLAIDATGRNFLRNYIRAFPESIRKDIRSGTVSQEIDPGDPVQVLRRKLTLVFAQEIEKGSSAGKVDDAMEYCLDLNAMLAWLNRYETLDPPESRAHRITEGDTVWWVSPAKRHLYATENEIGEIDAADVVEAGDDSAMSDSQSLPGEEIEFDEHFEHGVIIAVRELDEPKDKDDAAARSSAQGPDDEFQQRVKVLFDFKPQRKGDLSIKKGDTIVVLGASERGWGRARDLKTGAVGNIPLNYVDAIGEESEYGSAEGSGDQVRQGRNDAGGSHSALNARPRRLEFVVRCDADGSEVVFDGPGKLILEEPPRDTTDPRMVLALKELAEEDAWRNSVLRSLSEDVLQELVLLARGPWQFLPGGLQAGPSVQFQEVWCDKSTQTHEQEDPLTKKKRDVTRERGATIRVWRPFAESGFYILGDVATTTNSGHDTERPKPVTVVSDDDGMGSKTTTATGLPLLVPPLRYKLLWQDVDSDNDEHVSFWQPVAPEGYVSLGCVAVRGHSRKEPDSKREGLQQLRCVHQSCVQLSTLQHGLWSFRPGEAKKNEATSSKGGRAEVLSGDEDDHDDSPWRAARRMGNRVGRFGLRSRTSSGGSSVTGVGSSASVPSPTSKQAGMRFRTPGMSIWEIDNSSRTFVPVVAKQEKMSAKDHELAKSKLLSLNRVDAATIESRLCHESHKRGTEEDTKTRMLHGLKLTNGLSARPAREKANSQGSLDGMLSPHESPSDPAQSGAMSDELRPYHLGLASTTSSDHGSSELLLWILQLFSEFDSNEPNGMGAWARRVFSPELVHALLRFSRTASPLVRIKAIRMLAMVIRRTPAASLRGKLAHELLELRVQMEAIYRRQAQRPKDGLMDEMPLFSSLLCALAEVFVSVSLTQRQSQAPPVTQRPVVPPPPPQMKLPGQSDGENADDSDAGRKALAIRDREAAQEYFEVVFDAQLGVEILSIHDILIVHSVKPDGAAIQKGIVPGDIFWEVNNKRVSSMERKEMWGTIKTVRPLTVMFLRDAEATRAAKAREMQPVDLAALDRAGDGDEAIGPQPVPLPDPEATQGGKPDVFKTLSSAGMVAPQGSSKDVLVSKENWFEQLSELAAIMEALVHRDRVRMPSEFLMAEDTFLKLVLANHTAVVESKHPFTDRPIKGQVVIPGAEALMVRFDRRCATPFGKALQLSCNVRLNNHSRRDIHVETLQGNFGGCSVNVPASTMVYQFPVPQEMKWALHRTPDFKAPEIRVSNNGRTASLRKDKVWQTVFSTAGFNSGINMWEVRVDRTGPSANIFFGVAMKSAKVGNYLGSDDKGWGWIGCMACWHGGRKVRHRFGKRLKQGDIVRITLDIPRRAMSIACNGEDWGVAFNKLPLPSTVLKPGNELVPTFSFYNKDDQITLLSGSTACDPETAGILHQLRSSFEQQHAMARITPRFMNSQERERSSRSSRRSSGEGRSRSSRHSSRTGTDSDSERHSRRSSRRLARVRTTRRLRWSDGGGTGAGGSSSSSTDQRQDGDEGAGSTDQDPDSRAVTLSALGYPVEWCVQALNATEQDMNRAAEYLLAHSDRMAEESKQEAERAAVEAEEAVNAEEEEWLNHVNELLDEDEQERLAVGQGGDPHGASATAATAVLALQSAAASNRTVQREVPVTSTGSDDESGQDGQRRSSKRTTGERRSTSNEWGYRMTISPLFSRETTAKIAQEPKNAKRLDVFHEMFAKLSLTHDGELVRMVNDLCAKRGEDPLTLSPNDLEPTEEEIAQYKLLQGIPLLHLQLRFLLLRNFNRRLAHVLPLIDLSCPAHESALAAALRGVRGVVMSSVKKALFERVLADSHMGDDHWMQQNKVPTVTLDRNKAAQFLKTGRVDVKGTKTVFGQLFSQLHGHGGEEKVEKNPLLAPSQAVSDASLLRNSHRAWYTILAGERADDYGGPYRDVINQACQELLTPALPLFVPCPNQAANQGADRGKWVPAAYSTSHTNLRMYEFVGKLMGIAMRTKNPFVLDLPSFVWKQLCNDQVTVMDVRRFDLDFYNSYSAVAEIEDEEALLRLDLKFTMRGSDGRVVELIPGGNSTLVTMNRRDDYLKALERARLHELDRHCAAIARGLGTQVPRNLLSIFTADELELMVCGPPEIDIDLLKLNCLYGDGISESTPSVQLFWQVMEEFSQEKRALFLRFVWGRSRLPASTSDWERKFKISKLNRTPSDDFLPVGHTCFFSLDLPLYTSKQICHDKLLFAIENCVSIDADETTVARQAGDAFIQRGGDDDDDDDDDDDGNGDTGVSADISRAQRAARTRNLFS